jgi:hypothetical protein
MVESSRNEEGVVASVMLPGWITKRLIRRSRFWHLEHNAYWLISYKPSHLYFGVIEMTCILVPSSGADQSFRRILRRTGHLIVNQCSHCSLKMGQ